MECFKDEIIEHIESIREDIHDRITKKIDYNEYVSTNIYGMTCKCDYKSLNEYFHKVL